MPSTIELWTPEQLAERLGVSLRTVREMYYTNTWPHLRINKRTVRFTEEHFEQIIAMSERRPTTVMRDVTSAQKASELADLLGRKKFA
jgi:excisionase family DNA binding protein